MWIDVRYAVRMLAKSPGFALVAILMLALGIGANTAIFTVANTLLLRPLPYANPSRLALLFADRRGQLQGFSYLRYSLLRDQTRSFSGVAAFASDTFNLTGRGDPEQLSSARVSANFFDVLGVRPELGRTFAANGDQPEAKPEVMISHSLWLRRFGAAKDTIGESAELDTRDYTIIGVLPSGFTFSELGANVDIWSPRVFEHSLASAERVRLGVGYLYGVARLESGTTGDQAQAEMDVLNRQYQRDNPGRPDVDPNQKVVVRDLQQQVVANFRPALLVLMGAVGFVLLIACANVASLLLSRALGRKKEIAIRSALGASRGALIRQLIVESLLLAMVSGICGILLSQWCTHVLASLTLSNFPRMADARIDLPVLAFTVAISLASGILFGLAPALQLSKPDLSTVLRDEGRGSTGSRGRNRARNLLVIAQVALSMVLLVGSGLLIRSFVRLQTVNLGFDPAHVLTVRIALPPTKYATPLQQITFYNRVLKAVQSLPGVQVATITSALPLNPSRRSPMLPEGQPIVPFGQRPILDIQTISPDYTRVLRVPLLRGREFTDHDNADAPGVAIVNQAAVRRYWPNENPIGKHILLGQRPLPVEVVGVFSDLKNVTLGDDASPEVILPFPQLPWPLLNLSVRSAGDPHGLISAIRRQVSEVDKDQPLTDVQTLEELVGSASQQPCFTMLLLGVFSATALILAIVGIYGVIAYSVAQRTQELGIRIALGADQGDVLQLVVGHGLGLTLTGIVIGLAGAFALTRLMSSLLYQTSATDPIAFGASALLFTAVALLASYLPARRATRIDPTDALR
jgi:putative ABC transport system permease protein